MRESNFAFPAQNKACVCITSQLYDRRALDTTSPLPLFNSLTHLTYLTSTSPRIREIMTMDGGLERLVRLLHEFCLSPPPPENPSLFYGLAPPSARPPKPLPTLNPPSFDKHAAYRFSLAFQCVVNIGVRGSEPIRSRVVQAGTLEVVGCILEAWLAHKGFAIGPNASGGAGSANGWGAYGRETREQRHARRQQQRQMLRDVEEAAELARALQRQMSHAEATSSITEIDQDQDSSNETSTTTGLGSSTSGIEINSADADDGPIAISSTGRDRSGTVVARASWDPLGQQWRNVATASDTARSSPTPSISSNEQSRPSSRPTSETEDDGDVDMDNPVPDSASTSASASDMDAPLARTSRHQRTHRPSMNRHTLVGLGLGGDQVPPMNMAMGGMGGIGHSDAHIIINDSIGGPDGLGDVGMNIGGLGAGMAGEDGISLDIENNDDFAMGAPPGAPGAIPAANMGDVTLGLDADLSMSETEDGSRPASRTRDVIPDSQGGHDMERSGTVRRRRVPGTPDATPRAGVIGLPPSPSTASSTAGVDIPSSSKVSPSEPSSSSLPSSSSMASSSTSSRASTVRGISLVDLTASWNAPATSEPHAANHTLDEERNWDRSREAVQRGTLQLENPRRRDRDGDDGRTAHHDDRQNTLTVEAARRTPNMLTTPGTVRSTASNISLASTAATASTSTTTHSLPPSPYRDEDVLLSLQLLAYLSKYPHVRQAFYKKRDSFHPASATPVGGSAVSTSTTLPSTPGPSRTGKEKEPNKMKESSGFFRAFASATIRGKDKERANEKFTSPSSSSTTVSPSTIPAPRQTNVFSLVERFTYRPSSSELAEYNINGTSMNPPPRLPPEIQYWAGVIMRNACRKDDSRGGIRQCANMLCGRWEEYPREFAKCRRCRKAKYCGKECQSTAWNEGHRFWCSAKDADDEATAAPAAGESSQSPHIPIAGEGHGLLDRRERRDRERHSGRDRHGASGTHRSRGLDAFLGGAVRQNDASTSRAAEVVDRGVVDRGLALFNIQRGQAQVVPSQPRRPELASYGSADGPQEVEGADVGRRRSETVTGVMSIGSSTAGRSDLTIPPYVPNSTQRSHALRGQPEQQTSRLHRLLPTRNDSVGESSSRTGNEDHNMLLG
ncbi:hypothetical protein BT96DRAFT_1014663 [Gymnopus androsaceus JB14]|uniref:MYND-type domain-containing protein n=1 Tax=Gymnopus androsaceus JB14 TaxID=1447944 RepID=A0A6A4ID33_9AGAR|nr:hypothetical protein BT96DRAFT_1014663 [Gymnopus androsaceus JB14]